MKFLAPIARFRSGDLAPALGAYFGIAASTASGWVPAASETAFLAWLAGTVLFAAAAVDRRAVPTVAMLVVTAAWVLPPGASRGMAVTTLLAFALAAGAWRRRSELSSARVALPIALGIQILLRAEDLLRADVRGIAEVVLPAILTAVALAWLADEPTTDRLVAVVVASVVIAGSFDLSLATAFLILAGGKRLRPSTGSRVVLGVAAGGLLLLVCWDPRSALLAIAATMAVLGQGKVRSAAIVAVLLSAVFLAGSSWSEAWSHLLWVPIALPAVWLPTRFRLSWLMGLVITLAGARILPPGSAPAAGLLLLAWESDSPAWAVQRRWSAGLLGGVLFMANYPWLRLDPAVDALARFGLAPSALAALSILAIVGLATLARRRLSRAPDLALAALALAVLLHLPRPVISFVGYEPVTLSPKRALVTFEAPATPTRRVAIGASASNSLGLEAGTALATIRVRGQDGSEQSWTLKAGQHVGEWAARRSDLRNRPELEKPRPWVAWSVPLFFGRSFRSVHALDTETEVVAVEVERRSDIAPEVGLRIDHLDLRP